MQGRGALKAREEDRPSTAESAPAPAQPTIPQQGSAKFVFSNGSVYAGEWQVIGDIKRRHGFGRLQLGRELYVGDWREDVMHGKGRFDFARGCSYEGDWVDGRFHGQGTYVWPSGAMYSGEWHSGKMHGSGVFVAPNGSRFQGRFHNDSFVNAQGAWVDLDIAGTATAAPEAGKAQGAAAASSSSTSSSAAAAAASAAPR